MTILIETPKRWAEGPASLSSAAIYARRGRDSIGSWKI